MTANAPIDTHAQFLHRAMAWIGDEPAHPPGKRYPGGIYLPATTATTMSLNRRAAGGL